MHAPAASVAGVAGPGQRAHRMAELLIGRASGVTGWRSLALGDELTGSPWAPTLAATWSPPLPTPKNQARCPRSARFRGDRRETDATGRAERPSKWRG